MSETVAERISRTVAGDSGRLGTTVRYGANQAIYALISSVQIKLRLENGQVIRPPEKMNLETGFAGLTNYAAVWMVTSQRLLDTTEMNSIFPKQ